MSDLLSDLNDQQKKAVTHEGSPILILAGAGSGKTRALTYRAAYLINQGVPLDRILLTTFTNKAAQEMQSRLESLVGYRLPLAGTFHSLCARFLRRYGSRIGLDPEFLIYDSVDQLQLVKQVISTLNLDTNEVKPRSLLYAIEQAKQELLSPAAYQSLAKGSSQTRAARVYQAYQQALSQAHALDFNDLLFFGVKLFQTDSQTRDYYQDKLLHVLVDEYQDTNKAQYELTKLWSEKHQNLCVVGDAAQAIYSWRGADYKNLLALKRDFPNLTTVKLEQNYRSSQTILDAAYSVIAYNTLHPVLTLWTTAGKGENLGLYQARDETAEAIFVLDTITALKAQFNLQYADFTVLYRTNSQSRVFEEVFIRRGMPYVLVGGVKFYERKEVKDILAYLRLVQNQYDTVSLSRLEKLGKRRLTKFLHWLNSEPKNNLPPTHLFDEILKVTQYLERFDQKNPEDLSRVENVQELRSVAQNFSTLSEFLENVSLVEPDPKGSGWVTPTAAVSSPKNHDAVVFMTLHASKGLEFPIVFLVGLEEGLFPHSRSLLSQADLEEERRLCYVGITRAKRKIYLTYTASRLYFGSRSQNEPSRFIREIPSEFLDILSFSAASPAYSPSTSSLSDALLDQFLNDEIDIDTLLKES